MVDDTSLQGSRWVRLGYLAGIALLLSLFFGVSAREGEYALFVGVLTVGVTAYGISRQQEAERQGRLALERRERIARQEEARREKKIEAYNDVIEVWLGLLVGSAEEKQRLQETARERFGGNLKMVVPWAADEVLVALSQMREAMISDDPGKNKHAVARFMSLLLAIRSDLGYSNVGVDTYTVACLFINDLTREKWAQWDEPPAVALLE